MLCCPAHVAVCVLSAAVAGQPEVDRNQAEHLVGLLPHAHQPAASHLPLQTTGQLLQGPTRGRKPTCAKHVSTSHILNIVADVLENRTDVEGVLV